MAATQFFQKSLKDIVKGIRNHKRDEKDYIQKCISEIKEELSHRDVNVKVIAVQKMTYLHMIGYDMEYGAFQILEVMSSNDDFAHKRIGYLACTQCFHNELEVLQLIPNLLRKDLMSSNQYEAGLALSCISNICTPELAEHLVAEVANLLTSQRSYVRKKTLLALFKIFLQYPEALRPTFPRIKERLEDPDPSVTAAAVNVIVELARRNPANYLGMAPLFFKLMGSIHNNWTLIKIVKLFGALVPLEQRLSKKLAEPLAHTINTTQAKSLLYECLSTVASGMCKQTSLLRLAVDKLKEFIEDPDQNLKYLGLLGLAKVMQNNPKMLVDIRETIIDCLADEDITIRMRALDLVGGLVSRRNLHSTVSRVIEQLHKREDEEFGNVLVKHIVEICNQQNYTFVTNFEWYLRVLMDLTQSKVPCFEHGSLLETEFRNVITRVPAVRPFGVKCMASLLMNSTIYDRADNERSTVGRVLNAAAFLTSEYVKWVPNKLSVVRAMLSKRSLATHPSVQATIVQAVVKIYAYLCNPPPAGDGESDEEGEDEPPEDTTTAEDVFSEIFPPKAEGEGEGDDEDVEDEKSEGEGTSSSTSRRRKPKEPEEATSGIDIFLSSCDVDVQEHATSMKALLTIYNELRQQGTPCNLFGLFRERLRPVAEGAQDQVEPEGVDLETDIVEYIPPISDDDDDSESVSSTESSGSASTEGHKPMTEDTKRNNPHYLPCDTAPRSEEAPPVAQLPEDIPMEDFNLGMRGFTEKKDRGKGKVRHTIANEFEAPAGYAEKAAAKKEAAPSTKGDPNSVWSRLNVDLSAPVKEQLPTVKPYQRKEAKDFIKEEKPRKEKRRRRRGKDSDSEEEQPYDSVPGGKEKKEKKEKKHRKDRHGGEEKEERSSKSKKHRDKESLKEGHDRVHRKEKKEKGKEKEKGGDSKRKEKKEKKEKEAEVETRKEDKKEKKAKKKDEPEGTNGTAPDAPLEPNTFRVGPAEVKVVFVEASRSKKEEKLIIDVDMVIKNSGKHTLKGVSVSLAKGSDIELDCGEEFTMVKGAVCQDASKNSLKVAKGAALTIPLSFELTTPLMTPRTITAKISFTSKDVVETHNLPIKAPVSWAMQKKSISSDAFTTVMQKMNKAGSVCHKTEVTVPLGVKDAFAHVASSMLLCKVEVFDNCASLHGLHLKPDGKSSVCVLAKAITDTRLSLEFKTQNADLAQSLAEEAGALFAPAAAQPTSSSTAASSSSAAASSPRKTPASPKKKGDRVVQSASLDFLDD